MLFRADDRFKTGAVVNTGNVLKLVRRQRVAADLAPAAACAIQSAAA